MVNTYYACESSMMKILMTVQYYNTNNKLEEQFRCLLLKIAQNIITIKNNFTGLEKNCQLY